MSVNVGVDIKGNNRDLLRAVAGSKAALDSLKRSQRGLNNETQLGSRQGQVYERQLRNINNELRRQSQALRGVALDYTGVRRAVLSFSVRSAIVGIGQLTSALNAAGTAAVTLGSSLGGLGGALGIGFAASLAAGLQGMAIYRLALKGVGTAITTAGVAHENALKKLTQPQREFVHAAAGLREAYRQLQLVAQKGLFPGLIAAGREISSKLLPILRTGIYDTARALGYLAERGVGMLNKRLPEFNRVLQRNVITLTRAGKTLENFGAGLLDAFPVIEPLIGHMTKGLEKLSEKFKDLMGSKGGKNTLKMIVDDMRKSWDSWTSTFGRVGKSLFHIWDAIRPVTHKVEDAVNKVARNLDKWTGSHKKDIFNYFNDSLKPLGSMARLVGDIAKDFGKLAFANNDSTAKLFDSIRTKFLPVLMEVITILSTDLAPKVGDLLGSIIQFFDTALPGIKGLADAFSVVFGWLDKILNVANSVLTQFNKFGAVGSTIGLLAVGATVVAGWKMLRQEIKLTMQAASYALGVSEQRPSLRPFINALPGDKVITRAKNAVTNRYNIDGEKYKTYMSGGIPGMTDKQHAQLKASGGQFVDGKYIPGGGGVYRTGNAYSRLNLPVSQLYTTARVNQVPTIYGPRGGRTIASQYGTGSGVYTTAGYGAKSPVATPLSLPVRGTDKNGRPYYYDPATGRRVPTPMAYATPSGRVRNNITGRFVTTQIDPSFTGTRGTGTGIRSVASSISARTFIDPNAVALGTGAAMARVERDKTTQEGTVLGAKSALSHLKNPLTSGAGMLAGAGLRMAGPIAGMLALFGAIEALSESKVSGLGNKIKDMASGASLGLYKGPTKQLEGREKDVAKFVSQAGKLGVSDFNDTTIRTLKGQGLAELGGKKARGIQLEGTPRLDLTKLNAEQKEALAKLAELAEAGKDLAKNKITIPLDGSVTIDGANRVNFAFDEMKKLITSDIGTIKKRVKMNMTIIRDNLGADSEAGKEAISRNFTLAVSSIKRSMHNGTVSARAGWDNIRKLFRENLQSFGFSESDARHYAQGGSSGDTAGRGETNKGTQGAARGGMWRLPGQAGPDSIPMDVNGQKILAAPGEDVAIINRHQRRYLDERLSEEGGLSGVFKKVNRKHFAGGGWVTGDTDYKPGVGNALTKMAKAQGTPIYVQSGGRTVAEQLALASTRSASHPVAGPNGPHVRGIAADITPGREVFGGVAGKFGLGFTVPQESWHIQLLNAAAAGNGGAIKLLPRVLAQGVSGMLGAGVQGSLDAGRTALNSILSGLGSTGGDGSGPASAGGAYDKKALAALWRRAGGDSSIANLMGAIALAESSGNPGAHNASGASGLWQILGEPFPGDVYDPLTNARMAVAKYQTQGLGAWEAYTNGNYKTFMARGGWLGAAMGHLSSVTPPSRGTDPGAPDTSQAVPTDTSPAAKKKKTAKKKKPKVRDLAGGRPAAGSGIARSRFKPSSAKAKPIRKSIKKLLNSKFKINTFSATGMYDPITGEQLDITQLVPGLFNINLGSDYIDSLSNGLSLAEARAGMTDEQFIVSLEDTDQHSDLSDYLKSIGVADPEAWKTKYGDSMELVNDAGRNVQGQDVRGIAQFVAEINEQLGYHTTNLANPIQGMMGGGIRGILGYQKAVAESIPSDEAIAERRLKMQKMKAAVEATIELRKAQYRKMTKMGQKGYTWKEAVTHNTSLIEKWQRWKRDSVGETLGETRSANSEIDRLKDENKALKHDKPKGQVFGSAAYQTEYREWARSKKELQLLVGDGSVQQWAPQAGLDGGLAGRTLLTLNQWTEVGAQKKDVLRGLTTSIPQEDLTIAGLQKQITDATGSKAAINQAAKDVGPDTSEADSLRNTLNTQKLVDALTSNIQWDVLKNFAGLVGQRSVGSFAQGGVVPATGMALVHKGEFINPAPDGPFRNGSNAAGQLSGAAPQITLVLRDRAGELVELIDARVDGRAADVASVKTGRRQRLIQAAPGR